MFEAWGHRVYRRRWTTLAVSGLFLLLSIIALLSGGTLGNAQADSPSLQAARASGLVTTELNAGDAADSSFLIIFGSSHRVATDPLFRAGVVAALAPVTHSPLITGIRTPYTGLSAPYDASSPDQVQAMTSRDGHEVLARLELHPTTSTQAEADYASVRALIHSSTLTVTGTGTVAINRAFSTTLEADLGRAESVSLPVTVILLLLIFATVVAAGLPLGIGILSIVAGVGGTMLMSHLTDVSQYALNIVTLIGLAVSIDYSLIVVTRFREELARGLSVEDALARTVATAGRAITFSGLTVAVGLSAMLFYQGTFLASMGAAGGIVVAAAVFYGLTALPALLAILGHRVNRLHVPWAGRRRPVGDHGLWHGIAVRVMRRPVWVVVPTMALLLLMGSPFIHLRLANGSVAVLPPTVEARRGYDDLLAHFPGQDQTKFTVVVHYTGGAPPLTPSHIAAQYALSRRIAAVDGVIRVDSIYSRLPAPHNTVADYQRLYAKGVSGLRSAADQALFRTEVGRDVVQMTAVTAADPSSEAARTMLTAIRAQHISSAEVLVAGDTAIDVDVIHYIEQQTPVAVGFVLLITYVVMFLMTGSVVLPLKAVILNLVSISASFGALVWIFQDGHLSHVMNFTPQSIDPSVPVIMFAIVFGMSMDYEVLLLSRIQEEHRRTGDTTHAVAAGLEHSGRLITGAAAIMVAVFLSFGLADAVIIKAIGIGLAIAVAADATIVRALVVPALMRLLGDANWWSPAPLRRLHRRVGLAETQAGTGR